MRIFPDAYHGPFFWKSLAFAGPIGILVATMGTMNTIHLVHINGLIGRLALLLRR
ncbi:MAG TPA: hypothetical protein VLI39_02895 [Sedimentisphaerales bacterium]|nr:hypothetical protein [Sedimentisphaerales bacterium]